MSGYDDPRMSVGDLVAALALRAQEIEDNISDGDPPDECVAEFLPEIREIVDALEKRVGAAA